MARAWGDSSHSRCPTFMSYGLTQLQQVKLHSFLFESWQMYPSKGEINSYFGSTQTTINRPASVLISALTLWKSIIESMTTTMTMQNMVGFRSSQHWCPITIQCLFYQQASREGDSFFWTTINFISCSCCKRLQSFELGKVSENSSLN